MANLIDPRETDYESVRQNRKVQARLSNKYSSRGTESHDTTGENAVRALDWLRTKKMDDGALMTDRQIVERALVVFAKAVFEEDYEVKAQPGSIEIGYEVMQAARDTRKLTSKIARMLDTFRDDMNAMLDMMENVDLSSARQSPDWQEDTFQQAKRQSSVMAGFNVQSFIGDSMVADDDDDDIEFPEE